MRRSFIYFLIAVFIVQSSCDREKAPDCFQRAGDTVTEIRSLDDFTQVEIIDLFSIELVDTSWTGVIVNGPKNLLPEIQTDVSEGKLFISNRNTCNFMRRYDHQLKLRVCAPNIQDIQNFGTGSIFNRDTIAGPFMRLENRSASGRVDLLVHIDSFVVASHTGVADVSLRGKSRVAHVFNQGIGRFEAHDLYSTHVYANNSSIQDMSIRCSGYLFARIDFSGNIYLAGTPTQIDLDARSNGQLLSMPN